MHTNGQNVYEKIFKIPSCQGNANQKLQWYITSYVLECLSKNEISVGNNVEKLGLLAI